MSLYIKKVKLKKITYIFDSFRIALLTDTWLDHWLTKFKLIIQSFVFLRNCNRMITSRVKQICKV